MDNNSNNQVISLQNQNEMEETIDLREIFYALKKHVFLIALIGILCGCVAGVVTIFFMTPVFKSESSLLVISKETTLTSIADLQLGTQLTKDYKVLITTTSVLEEVIENLGIEVSPETLRRDITINNPSDTRILEISVSNPEPEMAKKIVDELAVVASDYIADKMEVIPPKIIEEGKVPTVQTSPSLKKNVLIGVLFGFMLTAGIIAAITVMDDSIKNEDDIAKYLGLSLLASIPDRKDYINTKSGRDKASKRKQKH